jgi:hypothetical protein
MTYLCEIMHGYPSLASVLILTIVVCGLSYIIESAEDFFFFSGSDFLELIQGLMIMLNFIIWILVVIGWVALILSAISGLLP